MAANTPQPTAGPSRTPMGDLGPGSASATLGWVAPPAHLELAQVHYIVRHGERTPVRTRLQNATPPIPTSWTFCHGSSEFLAAVADLAPDTARADPKGKAPARIPAGPWAGPPMWTGRMDIEKGTEGVDKAGRPTAGRQGECLLGELTDLGRQTTFIFGQRLRSLYVDKLHFLPAHLTAHDADTVYFRSTNMSRTIESAQSVIRGLLPQTRDPTDFFVPRLLIRNGMAENLLPNTFSCRMLGGLDAHFAKLAAAVHESRLALLDERIAPHCDGVLPRVDGHPRLNGVLDTVRAAAAHGIPVPQVFNDPHVANTLESAIVDEWFSGYRSTDDANRTQYRRLAMGRLLEDLNLRLQSKAAKGQHDPLKFALYAAHDTSLAGLLSTLDVFDGRWPAFTASVGLELFRDTRASAQPSLLSFLGIGRRVPQHYVRLRYGDRTLSLPACSAEGKHHEGVPELCTLEAFAGAVEALRHPDDKSWEQECEEGRPARSSK